MSCTDQFMQAIIGKLLRGGVLLAAFVVLCGGIVYLAPNPRVMVDYRAFRAESSQFRTLSGILADALAMDGQGIIQLGLLLLIATPIARVVFSILGFAAERDWVYAVFTVVVFLILLYSLLTGVAV